MKKRKSRKKIKKKKIKNNRRYKLRKVKRPQKKLKKKLKKRIIKKKKSKKVLKKTVKTSKTLRYFIVKILKITDIFKIDIKVLFQLDRFLLNFFKGISHKLNQIKKIVDEERERKKQTRLKLMQKEKLEIEKNFKIEQQQALSEKRKELREEIKLEKDRKRDLQKFIRAEQALVRKEQAERQRKFLEQIKLEKKIEQFRKREAQEITKLEKFVLNQERESYSGVEDRINAIKLKYQALRDQKIRERIQQLGIEVTDEDDRAALLEKEKQYNLDRHKIEFALESYYRSMASCVFQLNKRWIPKKMSLLRVIDRRFESSEVFIKLDEESDDNWLMLVYIKDNNPDSGIIVEDKTNSDKHSSYEYKTNEIFKFSDALVDSLTNYIDKEFKKKFN